jgi:hypothetical protein
VPRRSWSAINISSPRSRLAAACSPNCAPTCRGHNTSRRCGGCATPTNAGKDALLLCDTTEMTDALNQRLHHDRIAANAPSVSGARGHRTAVGDLILSRRNDAAIRIYDAARDDQADDAVRDGNRWQVAASEMLLPNPKGFSHRTRCAELTERGQAYVVVVWKTGHPISVRQAVSSRVSWGPTRKYSRIGPSTAIACWATWVARAP